MPSPKQGIKNYKYISPLILLRFKVKSARAWSGRARENDGRQPYLVQRLSYAQICTVMHLKSQIISNFRPQSVLNEIGRLHSKSGNYSDELLIGESIIDRESHSKVAFYNYTALQNITGVGLGVEIGAA
jgi:hypothetical protein